MDIFTNLTQLGSAAALMIALFYLHNQTVGFQQKSDDRWAALKTEGDARWKELQLEWIGIQKEILKINQRLDAADLTRKRL